jgi:hypothetical protein
MSPETPPGNQRAQTTADSVFRIHDEAYAMMIQPDGEEFAETTAEEFELDEPADELIRIAVDKYTAHGYSGINDCLFALLCDVTGLYANRTRTPGVPRLVGLDGEGGILDSVANNIAPERGFAEED